ncbi:MULTISPECIES: ABC transporter substrate-binding protein [unclassified Streptomyces]|uniref:ABC transporter substrate-binding protein n=1 Tax=unclassified Streptomyces TaxID=2593676 RepID=UPI002E2DEAAB|nr:ABC transporter substrate-binding protein [Streptomyces sp. NBC_01429]
MAAVSACGGSNTAAPAGAADVSPPKNLASSGTLTYGTAASFPPFESQGTGGQPQGFDIDMIAALSASMGLKPKALDIDFDGLIPALSGKRTDVINSAMYITPEREKQVDFVPYMVIGETLLTPKGNPKKISRVPEDLSGRTVAVTRGAIGETYMTAYNKELKKQGRAEMKIMSLPNNQDAMLAVQSGRADAFDTSTPGAAATLAATKDKFTLAATFKNETKIGIAVRKGDTSTKTAITAALNRFVKSGGYAELLAKYKLPKDSDYFASSGASSAKPSAPASSSSTSSSGS